MKLKKLLSGAILLSGMILCMQQSLYSQATDPPITMDIMANFIAGSEPTKPVDPDDPTTETGDNGTGANGPLSIDYIFKFLLDDELPIYGNTHRYPNISERPYIQVTDNRGTGMGWSIKASLSGFMDEYDGVSLKGSYIELKNGDSKSANEMLIPPSMYNPIILHADDSTEYVVRADAGTGTGTWVNRWYPNVGNESYVNLVVPGGAATKGVHSATLTWYLYDTP